MKLIKLETKEWIMVTFAMVLAMPIGGYFLYRRGKRVAGGILLALFGLIVAINLLGRLEIGAKR